MADQFTASTDEDDAVFLSEALIFDRSLRPLEKIVYAAIVASPGQSLEAVSAGLGIGMRTMHQCINALRKRGYLE
jgi:hypothetical protein